MRKGVAVSVTVGVLTLYAYPYESISSLSCIIFLINYETKSIIVGERDRRVLILLYPSFFND